MARSKHSSNPEPYRPGCIKGLNTEKQALIFLKKQGLKLITQNYHSRFGEIDLIMKQGIEVIFVEVRYRKNNRFGNPAATVNLKKQ